MQTCLICDDHPLLARALAMTIAVRWPDAALTVVPDFPSAWLAAAAQPQLCLTDLEMPGATPRTGLAGILAAAPATRLVVITGSRDEALFADLVALGIAGFLPKTSEPAVIHAAFDVVLAGGRYLPPGAGDSCGARPAPPGRLSGRQSEVVALLARGQSNKEIARQLGVTPATVKTHVEQVLLTLGAANRTDAAIKARELGII